MPPPVSPYRVLLIDDNDGDLRLFQEAITAAAAPITLVTCTQASAALDVLAIDLRFDLILSDLHMPHLSGVDLFKRLSSKRAFRDILMVLMGTSRQDALLTRITDDFSVPYFTKTDTWSGYVTLAHEVHVLLRNGRSTDAGRRFAARMTPSARDGNVIDTGSQAI